MTFLIDFYSETHYNSNNASMQSVFPTGADSGIAQSFQCTARAILRTMRMYFMKVGNPVGNLRARLYAHSGVYGTSSVPTGAVLAESASVAMAGLEVGMSLVAFTFSSGYVMTPNYYVATVVCYDATTLNVTNYCIWGADVTAPTHAGNSIYWDGAAWQPYPAMDMCFYVNGDLATVANLDVQKLNVTPLTIGWS